MMGKRLERFGEVRIVDETNGQMVYKISKGYHCTTNHYHNYGDNEETSTLVFLNIDRQK